MVVFVVLLVVVNIKGVNGNTGAGVVVVIFSTDPLTVVKFGISGGLAGVAGTNG
jgi:hypothetical protein